VAWIQEYLGEIKLNKKIIFVLSIVMFISVVYSLPFFEFFDSGIPTGWTQVQYNGTDGEWTWTNDGSYFFGSDGAHVEANSEYDDDLIFDVGLFTPSFDCTGLTFVTADFYRNLHTIYGIGEASLRTYSGGTDPENYEEELWSQNSSDSFFGVHAVFTFNPINYADPANVYLEFRYSSNGSTLGKFFKLDVLMIYDSNPGPSTVFFSEYIDGSGNNKALEIFNGSGDVIELDNYRINQSSNGGGWEYLHEFPEGISLNAGETWVIVTDEADPDLQTIADEILSYPSVVHFNGNDARGLEYNNNDNWQLIDVIGIPDEDPGTGWDVAGISEATAEHTLVRKFHTISGNTDWIESASTEERFSEWIVLPIDTFDNLGSFPNYIDDLWPPAFPEYSLIGENNVFLDWMAPIPLEEGWLYYHDDTIENGVSNGNAGSGLAVKFQPAAYPCTIEQVRFFCEGEGSSENMEIWIIGDDFSTILGGPYPITVTPEDWNTIDIDDIEITSGTFLVNTIAVEAVGPYIGRDDNTYEYGRTFFGNLESGFTDVSAWGMNYTSAHEAYVSYDRSGSHTLIPAIVKAKKFQPVEINRDLLDEIIVSDSDENTELRDTRDFWGYNVYRNDDLLNVEPLTETEYYDLDLDYNTYEYDIIAVYNSGTSDPLDAQFIVDIVEIEPMILPFIEDWSSGDMSANAWLPDPIFYSNWFVSPTYGNTEPSLRYYWWHGLDYSQTIYSFELDGTGMTTIDLQYHIDFDSDSEATLEEMDIEVFDGSTWNLIANYNNIAGSFDWVSESWNISEYAVGNIFQIRFVAHGEDAYNINAWSIDNIFIGNSSLPPTNLIMNEEAGFLTWDTPASGEPTGYNVYLDYVLLENVAEPFFLYQNLINEQTYTAGVSAVYTDGTSEITEINFTYTGTNADDDNIIPKTELIGNYPNPFNPSTTISFSVAKNAMSGSDGASFVTLEIFNLKGQKIKKFDISPESIRENLGMNKIIWNGDDDSGKSVSSGIYYYKLQAGKFSQTKKMILMK